MIENLLFQVIGIIIIGAALMVISAKNPVHSVLYLILVYINATALLIMSKVEFIGMMLLIVYVGAIAILFLFVVMMLNIKIVEINENQLRYLPIGGIIAIIFLLELLVILGKDIINIKPHSIFSGNNLNKEGIIPIEYVEWSDTILKLPNIKIIGQVLYTEYSYIFILASIILLVAMIGAILLTNKNNPHFNKESSAQN